MKTNTTHTNTRPDTATVRYSRYSDGIHHTIRHTWECRDPSTSKHLFVTMTDKLLTSLIDQDNYPRTEWRHHATTALTTGIGYAIQDTAPDGETSWTLFHTDEDTYTRMVENVRILGQEHQLLAIALRLGYSRNGY